MGGYVVLTTCSGIRSPPSESWIATGQPPAYLSISLLYHLFAFHSVCLSVHSDLCVVKPMKYANSG